MYCDKHTQLFADVQVIKEKIITSVDGISSHIKAGHAWRSGIISIAVAVVLNIIAFSYMYGKLCQKVDGIAYAQEQSQKQIDTLHPRK